MGYDVETVRAEFPALAEGAAHFDGPGGSQVPRPVAEAVSGTLTSAVSNRGRATRSERRADDIVHQARASVGDLLNADPRGVVFGRSMTALTYDFARTLAKGWHPGDEVVVTRLDHDANIRPWVQAAEQVGAVARFADFDPASGALEAEHVEACLSDRTVLVAVTAASNLIGTVPPVPEIARLAHSRGALVFVDGVHRTPHLPVDRAELEADFYVCSPYKFCGPHCGALAADPELLATLRPDKLLPATDEVPERFELGTLPYELLAGTTAAVDFLADVARLAGVSTASGSRRERLVESMQAVQAYEDGLRQRVESGLAGLAGVTLHGHATRRTPTLLFTVEGHKPDDLFNGLAASGVNAPAGSFYAVEASRHLGLGDDGGVRVGMAPYTSARDVDRLLDGVAALV